MIRTILFFLTFSYSGFLYSESYVKAGDSLVWDSENKSYTANGEVEFQNNIIKLTGNVSIQSPNRLLTGNELIADIDNNKRILNSSNDDSLVEVLLENNEDN